MIDNQVNDYIDFFCTSATIPEVRSNTVAVAGQENMGIVREQPTAIVYGKPLVLNVIGDAEFRTYRALRDWFDKTALNANQGSGTTRTFLNTGRSQRMKYYNTFARDMEIVKLEQPGAQNQGEGTRDDELLEVMKTTFIKSFIISLGAIALDSSAEDTKTEFQVALTYESYSLSYDNLGSIRLPGGFTI